MADRRRPNTQIDDDRVVLPELAQPGVTIEILDHPEPQIPYAEESDWQ